MNSKTWHKIKDQNPMEELLSNEYLCYFMDYETHKLEDEEAQKEKNKSR